LNAIGVTTMLDSTEQDRETARVKLRADLEAINVELAGMEQTLSRMDMTPWEQLKDGVFAFDDMADSLERVDGGLETFGARIQDTIVSGVGSLGSSMLQAARDGESMGRTMKGVFADIADAIADMAADLLVQQAFSAILRMFGGGAKAATGTSDVAELKTGTSDVAKYAGGGMIRGPKGVDNVPGMILSKDGRPRKPLLVTDGEAILNVKATSALGENFINDLNAGNFLKFAQGGMISSKDSSVRSSEPVGKVLTRLKVPTA
jgi:hypothetical protein